jgi:AcrR family transcriptional regulator
VATQLSRVAPEERRRLLVDAARDVYRHSGLAGARTKDIAARAGVAEGLIFKYFESKDGLFQAAVLERLEEVVADLAERASGFSDITSADRHQQSVQFHDHILRSIKEITPLLGAVLFSEECGQDFYSNHMVPLIDRATEGLQAALGTWPHPAVDARFLFLAILGAHLMVALDAHRLGVEPPYEAVSREMTGLLARSMAIRPCP